MQDPTFVYRGVHANHPNLAAARNGIAIPGRLGGTVSPSLHNDGGWEEFSPFTSWSRSYEVALRYASEYGPGFVILRIDASKEPLPSSWLESPDRFEEDEILLRGVRMGIEVIVDG